MRLLARAWIWTRLGALVACGLLLVALLPALATAATNRAHPFVFLTMGQIETARRMVREQPAFAKVARELFEKCERARLDQLPALERAWWLEARQKPWAENYPQECFITP